MQIAQQQEICLWAVAFVVKMPLLRSKLLQDGFGIKITITHK